MRNRDLDQIASTLHRASRARLAVSPFAFAHALGYTLRPSLRPSYQVIDRVVFFDVRSESTHVIGALVITAVAHAELRFLALPCDEHTAMRLAARIFAHTARRMVLGVADEPTTPGDACAGFSGPRGSRPPLASIRPPHVLRGLPAPRGRQL